MKFENAGNQPLREYNCFDTADRLKNLLNKRIKDQQQIIICDQSVEGSKNASLV